MPWDPLRQQRSKTRANHARAPRKNAREKYTKGDILRERLTDALKDAMRSQEKRATATLRLILAALKDRDIAARSKGNSDGIDETEILQMLQTMIKQRQESIAHYEQGGRAELAEREAEEIAIIRGFLPEQLGEIETQKAVDEVIAEVGAAGLKDMGKTMASLKERYVGQMDFGLASSYVKERLS